MKRNALLESAEAHREGRGVTAVRELQHAVKEAAALDRNLALKGLAPKRKADVRLHALSFYTRAAGRGARGETRTPTVIGLFC